jgi:hypothetical protein
MNPGAELPAVVRVPERGSGGLFRLLPPEVVVLVVRAGTCCGGEARRTAAGGCESRPGFEFEAGIVGLTAGRLLFNEGGSIVGARGGWGAGSSVGGSGEILPLLPLAEGLTSSIALGGTEPCG